MTGALLEPYLYFRGDCRAAMEFYRGALGGELDPELRRMPPGQAAAENPQWLMHAT